jgi:hypothetical protein
MAIKTKKFEWLTGEGSFSEQYGRGMQYALVNDAGKQVHHFVWCKDFLHDLIFGEINKEPINVYRFTYKSGKDIPPPAKKLRVAVANLYDKDFEAKNENALDFINQIEDGIGFIHSQVFKAENPTEKYAKTGVFVFEGSKRWLNAPVLLSMYNLLLRVGMTHTKGTPYMDTLKGVAEGKIKPYQSYDQDYSKKALPGIQRILRDKPGKIFHRSMKQNYPEKLDSSTMHHRFGIVTFAEGTNRHVMPAKWYDGVPAKN